MLISQRPIPLTQPKATCAAPFCEALTLCRGRRPHHARKEAVGTWETSSGPQSRWRSRAVAGTLVGNPSGNGWELDALVVPMKRPNKAVMSGGGGRGGKGRGRRNEGGAACSGHSTGTRMPQRRCSCTDRVRAGTEGPTPVTSDLRQEPGAGKPHAGICAGGGE